jgi:hypothetical protein
VAQLSPTLQRYIDDGLFARLPRTFGAYTFDRIKGWDNLFPAERRYFERLFGLLARSDEQAVQELFTPLLAVEKQMGIDQSTWSTKEFTLEQVDFLQRNRRLPQWRQAIADIFARIDPLLDAEAAREGRPRLVIVVTPPELPMGPDRMWARIKDKGTLIPLAFEGDDPLVDYLPKLLTGAPRAEQRPTLYDLYSEGRPDTFDAWVVEAGDPIHRLGRSFEGWTGLSYERLAELRAILMEQVNDMVTREQIPGPRQLGERLQRLNPGALKRAAGRDPVLRDFLQSVLLNGNGTLLINNTFVEWTTIQAIRRARPALVCASFGIRNKVKPFSSLLIYADQEESNPIPTQADMLGSYVDLEIFHQYLYQECEKWPEYRLNTTYLFVGEGLDALLAIGPPDFPLLAAEAPVRLEDVFREAKAWLGV